MSQNSKTAKMVLGTSQKLHTVGYPLLYIITSVLTHKTQWSLQTVYSLRSLWCSKTIHTGHTFRWNKTYK